MSRTAPAILAILTSTLCIPAAAAQWSTPTNMTALNSVSTDFYPALSRDGLTLWFSSNRTGGGDIYKATRTAPYAAFGAPVLVPELNDATASDYAICLRFDQRELFMETSRTGGSGSFDIWRADRLSPTLPFNAPTPTTELNSASAEWSPTLTGDGLRIYFVSNRAGGTGSYDIWTATRPSWVLPFGTPTPVSELNSTGTDRDPWVSPDGLTIVFASSRNGPTNLFLATRLTPTAPFGNITELTALSTAQSDFTPSFGIFHDEVFFCSQRPGGQGVNDLWTARWTGIAGNGLAGLNTTRVLRFCDPGGPNLPYIACAALGTSPGIPIDTRVLPLTLDLLLVNSIGGLPPVMTGYAGVLDADGIASGQISFAGLPSLLGFRFFNAFLTLQPSAPSGIRTISASHEVQAQ